MTDSLILDSLEIHNFRAFEHLLIEKLGRVNLIVGKNNVGKTCVLEALQLYASKGSHDVIRAILDARSESAFIKKLREDSIYYLFHVRNNLEEISIAENIEIGSIKGLKNLIEDMKGPFPKVYIGKPKDNIFEAIIIDNNLNSKAKINETKYVFVSDKSISKMKIVKLWNDVYLTDSEEDIVNILRIIEPTIKNIGFVDEPIENGKRVPKVRLTTSKTPVLLSSLGEGMNRLLGIALALVNSKDGFLLIDEIDNGIHYSAQPDLWRLIFAGAKRMNVQVFATTHSWDCIEAFQQAATESGTDDGMLISLRQKKKTPGHVVGFIFEGKDLEIVTRDRIEVR
jgi:AAA15 family ATPase/GTPase